MPSKQPNFQNISGQEQFKPFELPKKKPTPTVTPPTPTVPPEQSLGIKIADALKATTQKEEQPKEIDPVDETISRLQSQLGESPDRKGIRREVAKRFQSEIDATNQIFQDLLARTQRQGKQDTGISRAMAASQGLLGSPRGQGQIQTAQEAGQLQERGVLADQATALADVNQRIEDMAGAEFATERERFAQNAVAQALDAGLSDPTEILNAINFDERGRQIGDVSLAEVLAVQEALTEATPEGFTLSEGQARIEYNPETGQYERVAFNPKTGTSSKTGLTKGTAQAAVVESGLKSAGIDLDLLLRRIVKGGTAEERSIIRQSILTSPDPLSEIVNIGVANFGETSRNEYSESFDAINQLSQAIGIIEGSSIEFSNPRNFLRQVGRNFGKDSPQFEQIKFVLEGVNAPIRNAIFGASLTEGEKEAANAFLIDTQKDSREAILNKSRGIQATLNMSQDRKALVAAGISQGQIQKLIDNGLLPSYEDYLNQYGVKQQFIPSTPASTSGEAQTTKTTRTDTLLAEFDL